MILFYLRFLVFLSIFLICCQFRLCRQGLMILFPGLLLFLRRLPGLSLFCFLLLFGVRLYLLLKICFWFGFLSGSIINFIPIIKKDPFGSFFIRKSFLTILLLYSLFRCLLLLLLHLLYLLSVKFILFILYIGLTFLLRKKCLTFKKISVKIDLSDIGRRFYI